MRIDPAGWPFIIGALALALVVALGLSPIAGAALVVPAGFFLFFFRDPDRSVTRLPGAIVSSADGRVMVAGAPTGDDGPAGTWQQVSVFLSPVDVHVNRMPVGGRVTKVRYHPGRFLPAYKAKAGDLNEYTEVWVEHDGLPIVVRQIVGILARRVVCRLTEGALVQAGDRFGVMKFGSRMDVFVPATAYIRVRVGDRVVVGVTVIAILAEYGR